MLRFAALQRRLRQKDGVGRYASVIADRHNARNDFSRQDRLYYQVSTVTVPSLMFIQTRGLFAACLLNDYVL